MKKVLFIVLAAAVVGLSACSDQSPNGPDNGGAGNAQLTKALSSFNVTTSQMSVLDEMYYLNEDLSIVLTPKQETAFNTLSVTFDGGRGGPGNPMFPRIDMGFLMQLRLIFQANPDMTDERKAEFTTILQQYQEEAKAIIERYRSDPTLDPAKMREELQALHDKYQAAIDGKLTTDEKAKVDELKAKIEAERKEMREKLEALRIERQLQMWTRILGLTEEQQIEIRKLLQAHNAYIQTLRDKYVGDPAGFRLALLEAQKALHADIAKALTPDQLALWERLMQRMGRGGNGGGGTGGGRG